MHSTASDGTVSPDQLPDLAKNTGLQAIALTDHDTTDGLEQFMSAGQQAGIEVIPGIEFSSYWHRSSLHVVGLFIDPENSIFKAKLKEIVDSRLNRNELMVQKLNSLGFEVELDDWYKLAANSVPGRPHLASVLVNKGYFKTPKQAFDELIGNNRPGHVSRQRLLSPSEAIKAIHDAGGLAIWAHPCAMRNVPYNVLKKIGAQLKTYGLDGIETMYSHFTEKDSKQASRFADSYNILKSGGSDFHGDNSPGVTIGSGKGQLAVPYEFLQKMKDEIGRN